MAVYSEKNKKEISDLCLRESHAMVLNVVPGSAEPGVTTVYFSLAVS